MTEHQYIKETERAQLARQILENPLWQAAWEDIETRWLSAWRQSPVRDTEARERLWLMLTAGDLVRATFETHLETGKMAEISLEEMRHKRSA